jgi:hypothetical protein
MVDELVGLVWVSVVGVVPDGRCAARVLVAPESYVLAVLDVLVEYVAASAAGTIARAAVAARVAAILRVLVLVMWCLLVGALD